MRNHVVESLTPGWDVDVPPLTPGWESGFDSITESWYGKGAVLNPIERRYMTRDEESFCDRLSFRSIRVDEVRSALG